MLPLLNHKQYRFTFRMLLIFSMLLMIKPVFSQSITQTIKGKVIDNESQAPLVGANVIVNGTNLGATSDIDGNYRIINVPVGRYNLQVSYIGYDATTIPEILVSSAKEEVVNIPMKQSVTQMNEVTVKAVTRKDRAQNTMATISARSFTVEETRRYAGGMDDPARMVSAFAGVTVGNLQDNAIIIRGNAPKGVSWRLEGVEIPNPNHFANGNVVGGGFLTALSSQVLANSDFFTGAFPAEYGSALAGVFDMKLRTGYSEKREHAFQAGLMGLDFSSEGPFVKGKNATYLFNYRYSTFSLLDKLGIMGGIAQVPKFQDLSFKLNFPTQKAGTFSLWGIGAMDENSEPDERDSTKWKSQWDRVYYMWTTNFGAVGLNNKYIIDNQTLVSTTLSASGVSDKMDGQRLNDNLVRQPDWYRKDNSGKINLNCFVNHKFSAKSTLKMGINYSQLYYNLKLSSTTEESKPESYSNIVDERGNTGYSEFYAQSKYDISPAITLNAGFNTSYFWLNNDFSFDPRLGIRWAINPKHSLSFGYGKHSQMEDLNIYLITLERNGEKYQPNKNLQLSQSQHFVLGYDWLMTDNIRLKVEPYYQYLYNIPGIADSSFSMINLKAAHSFRDSLVNNSKGYNYGVDITFERFLNNNYYYLFTLSLFDSQYKGGDGVWRNTRYNKQYAINLLVGKEFFFKNNKVLGLNARFNLIGGERVSPVLVSKSLQNKDIYYDETKAFSKQDPATNYLDFTVTYRINKKRYSSIWALQVKNVLGCPLRGGEYYNLKTNTIETEKYVVILPVLSYKIEF